MPDTIKIPYDWVRNIDPKLVELDQIPLYGNSPPFPWEEFTKNLAESLEIESFKITPLPQKWRTKDALFEGLASPLVPFPITIASMEGNVTWLFSEEDLPYIISCLITKDPSGKLDGIELDLQEGFFNFLALEAIHTFNQVEFDKTLSPHLTLERNLPSEEALCLDIEIKLFNKCLLGRLVIPQTFLNSWKDRYSQKTVNLSVPKTLAEKLTVPIDVEIGRTSLPMGVWPTVKKGDFLLLDHCGIDPTNSHGTMTLRMRNTPLYQGAYADGKLTISETPPYQEVESTMNEETTEEELLSEEDFSESTFEDTLEEEDLGLGLEEDFAEESIIEEAEKPEEEEATLDEEAQEGGEELEEAEAPSEEEATDTPLEETETEPEEPGQTIQAKTAKEKPPISKDKLPITIRVEVGRLEMPVQQLLDLKAGNLLELEVKPEDGVNLVVNGQLIGKGELLKVGEALGVRILDLG